MVERTLFAARASTKRGPTVVLVVFYPNKYGLFLANPKMPENGAASPV